MAPKQGDSLKFSPTLCVCLVLTLLAILQSDSRVQAVGVNWGTTASHPLPPPKVVELLKSNNISKVKLFDADPVVLQALSGSNIDVTIGIPNSMLKSLNSSLKVAEAWVHDNLTRYLANGGGGVRIEYIAIGDEPFLKSYGDQFHPYVIGATTAIQTALIKAKLVDKVKVVVPCSFDVVQSESNLPSKAHFRPDLNRTMIQLLTFLSKHHSPFFININPFLSLHQNKNISLNFALFKGHAHPINDSHRIYKNVFDLSYDSFIIALSTIGFPQMDIVIGKIGWPTDGAANATSAIAETFMKDLVDHLHSKTGTRFRPKEIPLEVYIFSLLDEDKRNIATGNFERHWGIFTFDGQAKYRVDFGQGLRNAVNVQNVDYLSSKWCVVNNNKDLSNATAISLEACSSADCSSLSPGGSCSNIIWPTNISYAFNSFYQQNDQRVDSCNFSGLGLITTVDPSLESCRFSVGLRNSFSSSLHRGWWVVLIIAGLSVNLLDAGC